MPFKYLNIFFQHPVYPTVDKDPIEIMLLEFTGGTYLLIMTCSSCR